MQPTSADYRVCGEQALWGSEPKSILVQQLQINKTQMLPLEKCSRQLGEARHGGAVAKRGRGPEPQLSQSVKVPSAKCECSEQCAPYGEATG